MTAYGIGSDYGNSLNKCVAYANGKERPPLVIESSTSRGSLETLVNNLSGMGKTFRSKRDALDDGEYVIEYGGREYYVGKLAMAQSRFDPSSLGRASRYWSEAALLSVLTTSATLIKDQEFEVCLVTGLPVAAHKESNIKLIKDRLNGTHEFNLNGRERVVHIKVGKVLMEAAGAVLINGLEEGPREYGVIDIGSFTTDIYTLNGLKPVSDKCASIEMGVASAALNVARRFDDEYGFPLSPMQQSMILPCYLSGNYYGMGLGEDRMCKDIQLWTDQEIEAVHEEIQNKLDVLWRSGTKGLVAANFARVDVVGGGAYYMTNLIQKNVPRAKMVKKPEFGNVRGYAFYANELVKSRG